MNIDLWPLLVYSIIIILLVPALLVASALLGQRRKDHATDEVYESGVVSTGSAHLKIAVPFYLTAILFIIFDLEAAFLFAWAIAIREAGWVGYIEVVVFIVILLAGLLYLWKAGALEWRTLRQQRDLANLKGEGGVVNVGPKAAAAHNAGQGHASDSTDTHGHHDDHGHDAHGHGGAH